MLFENTRRSRFTPNTMKNAHLLTIVFFCTLFLCGCQDDSDYLIGKYTVTITTELSSCGAEIFAFSSPDHLPTSSVTGHQGHEIWRIARVGITGTGAEKIQLDILSEDAATALMTLMGTLEHSWLHSETVKPFTSEACAIQRVIALSGQFKDSQLTGSIRTTLASGRQSATCALPFPFMCEVTETFIAMPE